MFSNYGSKVMILILCKIIIANRTGENSFLNSCFSSGFCFDSCVMRMPNLHSLHSNKYQYHKYCDKLSLKYRNILYQQCEDSYFFYLQQCCIYFWSKTYIFLI